ncbi:MAG: HEAT repeat domain-containing protein [Tepidisphaerales bacterium]
MTPNRVSIFAAVVLLTSTAALYAQENVAELVRDLSGDKPTQRTPEQLDAAYAKVLDALLSDMGSDDAGKRGSSQATIERIAFNASRPGAEAERAACAKACAARAAGDAPLMAKVWLIRQLERIGRVEAVPQLAKLLGDADALVRESARRALMKNPAPEAGEALRQALSSTDVPWCIALVNALAVRMETANLSILLKEAVSDNEDIQIAALRALGKLGDKSAVPVVSAAMTKGSDLVRQVATDAYLTIAEGLANKGDAAGALAIYKSMLTSQGYLKCAAIVGIGRTGSAADLPSVFDNAADPDAKLRGACVEAMAMMKGNDVTAAIAAKANTAPPEAKPALLLGLARRGDKSTVTIFISACEDANEDVRLAAIRGIATIGDASTVPLMLKIAAGTGATQEAARLSLARLQAADVDQALMAAMGDADAKVRLEAIRATVARHVTAAAPALLKAAEGTQSPARGESIKALGSLATADALAPVAAILLGAEDNGIRQEAANALASIAGREADPDKRSDAILKALAGSSGVAKVALLGIMSRVGGQKSLDAVRDAVKVGDEKIKDAAIRALADWQDISAAEDLLAIAKTSASETHQVLALRGCIRIVREANNRPAAERGKLLITALETAKRPDEKRQAISALGEIRTADALQAVASNLGTAGLSQEAAQAAVRIGRDLANDKPEAVKEAMQKALEITKNEDLQQQAREALDRAEQRIKQKAGK